MSRLIGRLASSLVLAAWTLTLIAPSLAGAAEPVFSVRAEPASDPWWQRASWNPRATSLYGMSVKRLQPGWCVAEALRNV